MFAWIFLPKEATGYEPNLIQGSTAETELLQQKLIDEAIKLHEERLRRIQEHKDELLKKAQSLQGKKQGQCVVAVRKFIWGKAWNSNTARSEIKGSAKNTKVNSQEPALEAIVVLDTSSKHDHVAVILDFDEDSILIYESNFAKYEVAGIRRISRQDKSIMGYRIINK